MAEQVLYLFASLFCCSFFADEKIYYALCLVFLVKLNKSNMIITTSSFFQVYQRKKKQLNLFHNPRKKHVEQIHFKLLFSSHFFLHLFYVSICRSFFFSLGKLNLTLSDQLQLTISFGFDHVVLSAQGEPSMLSTSMAESSGFGLLFMTVF